MNRHASPGSTHTPEECIQSANNFWEKVRTNAFAHKVSMQRNGFWGRFYVLLSIFSGLMAILAVLLSYIAIQSTNGNNVINIPLYNGLVFHLDAIVVLIKSVASLIPFPELLSNNPTLIKGFVALILTLLSVFLSVISLTSTIFAALKAYDAKKNEHDFLQSMCLDIAQSCGPLKSGRYSMQANEFYARLNNLEEQFRLIKMRGSEPSDQDFRKAHQIMKLRHMPSLRYKLLNTLKSIRWRPFSKSEQADK